MKVIIVDDSSVTRIRLAQMLSELPDVELCGQYKDGLDALASIAITQPDVAILDIRMPIMSGIEVLEAIKRSHHGIRVIMFTNYAYPQYRITCTAAGADYFFDKATDFAQIPRALADMLEGLAA